MENTSEKKDKNSVKKPLKHICIGLVAHVDAGKTTLSEGMLYLSGQIRNMGRVDHGDTFLDNYETERERGITIFSKQAEFIWNDTSITILDTPGHVDFSAEMERVLQVLDCAVLVVSAVDGVQAHTVTLWRLLKQYKIPTMIFVNKMDRQEADREKLLEELKNRFGDGCVEMDMQSEENRESLAMCDETMLEEYLSGGKIEKETVKKAVAARKVFPCWFGSALKAQGIEALMSGLCEYAPSAEPLPEFGAKVYKIARDPQGNRLTYLKVTGGQLRVKDVPFAAEQSCTGKVNQIRKYSGEKYELVFTILKGGAFARYRCGDMYRCVGLENREDETRIPRFEYVDRVPWIIDIAGFTRISENGIRSVIALSKLPIINWVATKEYNEQNRPYLHMYVELERDALLNTAMSTNILKDLLSTYFKYIDQDYRDLKKILGMDPLQVTIFTCGTFETYEKKTGKKLHQMNPSYYDLKALLEVQECLNKVR